MDSETSNYQQIKQQILDALLSGKSTSALSLKLGFSFDQVKRWKNGSKQLRWNEFCDLCVQIKAPLFEALAQSLGLVFHQKEDVLGIARHLKIFSRLDSTSILAERLDVSPSALQRYLNEETYPDLEFVLEMIDLRPHFLNHFIDQLLDRQPTTKLSMISLPWTSAVANAASLPAHAQLPEHSSSWIARFLGISESQVQQAIDLMLNLGLIERKGSHFAPTLARTIGVSQAAHVADYSRFIRYWIRRAENRFATSSGEPINVLQGPNKDAFRIFAASPKAAQEITQILIKAEAEIHDLLQQCRDEKTDVRVLLFHHFSAQDFAATKS